MRKIILISSVSLLLLAPFASPQATKTPVSPRGPSVAAGSQGVVVSGKAAATAAGIKILEQGGNAADAAAATLLALSVTYVGAFCVGGEVPILVYSADQKSVKLLEGQGEAPRDPKAIAWYMQDGIPDGDVKAAAVPGTIDAIVTLLKLYGTKSFEEVVQPTLAILDAGGPSWYVDTGSGQKIETGVNWQADLVVTFRKLVESERAAKGTRQQKQQAVSDRFYRGDIADALEAWYIEKGGFLRKADLAAHTHYSRNPAHQSQHVCGDPQRHSTRPRITLSPTLLFHDNRPLMAISVAGGDQQDQAAIQVILNYVEFGKSPEEAFKAPRFSTTHFISSFGQDRARLGSLSVPNTLPEEVKAELKARGHVVSDVHGGVGGVALIGIDPKTRQATAVGPAAGKMEEPPGSTSVPVQR